MFSKSQRDSFVIHDNENGRSLDVVGDWTPQAAKLLARGEADGLILNYARGFRERNLDFLRDWPVRRLTILARTITDLEPIYRLSATLEQLSLATSEKTALDLTRLPRLKHLSCENWTQIGHTISSCTSLDYLYTGSYTPRDLLPLANSRSLTAIRMKDRPRLESLNGVDAFASLVDLGIFGASLLTDVVDLGSASAPRTLRTLELELCRGISTLDEIGRLTGLTYLTIGDCGDIASFAPLANLRHLKELYAYGTTRVVDGDLSPLMGLMELTDVRMQNRRDYSPSLKSIKEQIEHRAVAGLPADSGLKSSAAASNGRRDSLPMTALLSDLADAGSSFASVSDLRNSGLRYEAAVPALLKWLPKVPIEEKEDIVRALSVPWARSQALDPLIAMFKADPVPSDPMGESLRWAVGNALEVLWDDSRFDELVALTMDQRYGNARQMVVLGLGRSKVPEAVDVLIKHLDDPAVSGHAVKALGKLREPRARAGLESMTTDKRIWVRKAAETALLGLKRVENGP